MLKPQKIQSRLIIDYFLSIDKFYEKNSHNMTKTSPAVNFYLILELNDVTNIYDKIR